MKRNYKLFINNSFNYNLASPEKRAAGISNPGRECGDSDNDGADSAPNLVDDPGENDCRMREEGDFESNDMICVKPSSWLVREFEEKHPRLFKKNANKGCKSRYEFNLLNMRAYLDNWNILDEPVKVFINRLIRSDTFGNCYRYGMKCKDEFEMHLLLMAGAGVWERTGLGAILLSNLKRRDHCAPYTPYHVQNRFVDPRTCWKAGKKMEGLDFEKLLRDCDPLTLVFESDKSYRLINQDYRDRLCNFFKVNACLLKKWSRSGKIEAYLYSHEISCDSILRQQFRPHTHAVVFYPRGTYLPDLSAKIPSDRELKNGGKTRSVGEFAKYMVGAQSLVAIYEREFPGGDICEFNRLTVEAFHALLDTVAKRYAERSYRRFGRSKIPKMPRY